MKNVSIRFFICASVALSACCIFAAMSAALPTDRLSLADNLYRRGMFSEAAGEYEALLSEKSLPIDDVLFRLGESMRRSGANEKARAVYAKLLNEYPNSPRVYSARLQLALLSSGKARETELRRLASDVTPKDIRIAALYHLGIALEKSADGNKEALSCYNALVRLAPDSEYGEFARLRAASLLAASPNASDRRKALGEYLELAGSKNTALAEEALFFAANLCFADAKYSESASLFRRLIKSFPNGKRTNEAVASAAWSEFLTGHDSEALALIVPAIGNKKGGDSLDDLMYLRGAALRRLERRAEAVSAYTSYIQAFPSGRYYDAAWFERLATMASNGDNAKVLAELAACPDPPSNIACRAWAIASDAAQAITNMPLAVQYARLGSRDTESPLAKDASYRLGWLLEKTGDETSAVAAYHDVAVRWPKDELAARALFAAGMAEARLGRIDDAMRDWSSLLARFPDSSLAVEALYRKSMENIRQKNFRAASMSLAELLRRFPNDNRRAEVLYWSGITARSLDDSIEAEKFFRASLAANPITDLEREDLLELGAILKSSGREAEAAKLFVRLLGTSAVDRISADRLAWIADTMVSSGDYDSAIRAAEALEKRTVDAGWTQTAATIIGEAREAQGAHDAALAAYRRALNAKSQTVYGAQAALAAGRLETAAGMFDAANTDLANAVERSGSNELLSIRARAYAALAANEEARGDAKAALGYHLLVGTLFDDASLVPHALSRAAALSDKLGKTSDASELRAELLKRYPASEEAKSFKK